MSEKSKVLNFGLDPNIKNIKNENITVWSHDKNSYVFNFYLDDGCGGPLVLVDAKPRILLILGKDIIQVFDLTIVSERLGQAYFIIPDRILGYEGRVKASVYVDYEDKTHDLGSFYFDMKKSDVDGEFEGVSLYIESVETALKKAEELNEQIKDRDLVTRTELAEVEKKKANKESVNKLEQEVDTKATKQETDNKLEKKTDNETFLAITADMKRRIESTQSGMLGEFDSEAQLKAEYPQGAKGYAVVWLNENGEKVGYTYTYKNGSWVKGNVWNGVGIPNDSVGEEKLKQKSVTQEKIAFNPFNTVRFTKSNFDSSFINYDENACLMIVDDLTGQATHNYQIQTNDLNKNVTFSKIEFLPKTLSDSARVYVSNNENDIIVANFLGLSTKDPRIDYFRVKEGVLQQNLFPRTDINISESEYYQGFTITLAISGDKLLTYFNDNLVAVNQLKSYFNGEVRHSGIALRGTLNANSHIKNNAFLSPVKEYMFLSIDDTVLLLKELNDNQDTYSSIFDNPKWAFFKELRDKYGLVVSFWLYSESDDWDINQMTTKFRDEFAQNSNWIKFGFHSKNSSTKYGDATGPELLTDYNYCLNQIRRFATDANIDAIPRFDGFTVSKTAQKYLKGNSALFEGVHGADDNRVTNAGLSGLELSILQTNDDYYDIQNDLYYIRTETRLDRLKPDEIQSNLNNMYYDVNNNKIYNLFLHENFLNNPSVLTTVKTACKWAFDKHIRFDYPINNKPVI